MCHGQLLPMRCLPLGRGNRSSPHLPAQQGSAGHSVTHAAPFAGVTRHHFRKMQAPRRTVCISPNRLTAPGQTRLPCAALPGTPPVLFTVAHKFGRLCARRCSPPQASSWYRSSSHGAQPLKLRASPLRPYGPAAPRARQGARTSLVQLVPTARTVPQHAPPYSTGTQPHQMQTPDVPRDLHGRRSGHAPAVIVLVRAWDMPIQQVLEV